jgi:hypothetical protein
MSMPGEYSGGYLEVDKATFYTIFKEEDKTLMVDELPLPKQKRLGRRLIDRQYSALVTGRVTGKAGASIQKGTAVAWKDGRGTPYPFSDGRFAMALQNPGKYRIELKGPGFAKSSQELLIEQGRAYRLNFTLGPGGTIRGKVVDAGKRPVPEGDVFYRDGDTSYGVSIDRDGTYRIEGLAPGQYTVTVMLGDKNVSQTARVEAGRETVADFVVK